MPGLPRRKGSSSRFSITTTSGPKAANKLRAFADDPEVDAQFGRTRIRLEPDGIPWKWIMNMDGRHNPGANLGSALFRASVLRRIDGFDESRRFGEDFDYFDRLRAAGMRYVLHDGDALIYRRHATNCTNDQQAVQNSIFDSIRRKKAGARSPPSRRGT